MPLSSPSYVKPLVRLLRSDNSAFVIAHVKIEAVCSASYSAKDGWDGPTLAAATRANLDRAIEMQKNICMKAPIVAASCSHPFLGAAEAESEIKSEIAKRAGARYIDAGPILNSITEMRAWKAALGEKGIEPKSILIVTCELHSKSERILAGMVFRGAKVFVSCNSHELEVEPDHPTKDQRTWPRWLVASVLRFIALKAVSLLPQRFQNRALDRLARVQHD